MANGNGLKEASANFELQKTKLTIAGERRQSEVAPGALGLIYEVKHDIRVAGVRGEVLEIDFEVGGDDLVEIETTDGALLWVRPDELEATFGIRPSREGNDTLRLPTSLHASYGTERGIVGWAIKGLRVIGIDVTKFVAKKLAEKLEESSGLEHGLYRFGPQGPMNKRIAAELQPTSEPWLIFLHGTFSSGTGSFGDLVSNSEHWSELNRTYTDRILSLEHRSVTVTPVRNAIDALEALPKNAELHLVSHSRGGLIGELLCRSRLSIETANGEVSERDPFDHDEFGLFESLERDDQLAELNQLNDLLLVKRPKVTRFVRVACPARGTALASGRLDKWLNMVFDVVGLAAGKVPFLGTLHEALKDLAIAVAAERTDPNVLPGLEAMMPEKSPLIAVLNRGGVIADADLRIVQGDIESSGLAHRLKVWFSDAFYRGDHDLVVDTPSMAGGLIRKRDRFAVLDQGSDVDHFSYFKKGSRTARLVVNGLVQEVPDGFSLLERPEPPRIVKPPQTRDVRSDQPHVFIVPGIAGSYLDADGDRAWISVPRLGFGGLGKLEIDRRNVEAVGLVAKFYEDLCTHLTRDHQVWPWPYDWRRSIAAIAKDLADDIERQFDASPHPIRIVAHSMGGLVARMALSRLSLQAKFKERPGCRLLMLGTPNKGSWAPASLLTAHDLLARAISLLDITRSTHGVLEIVSRFPGLLQMLPHDQPEVFTTAYWQNLKDRDPDGDRWPLPHQSDLDAARAFVKAFSEHAYSDKDRMFYVAGQAETIDGIDLDVRQRINFNHTLEGDGRVTWDCGLIDGVKTWYLPVAHGDLARQLDGFEGLHEIITKGDTSRISKARPTVGELKKRSASDAIPETAPTRFDAERTISLYPDEDDILRAVIGARTGEPPRSSLPVARVKMVNGDLTFARHPLLVGHYQGDNISGTEAALDGKLDGKLTRRNQLDVYPSVIGTTEVVLDAEQIDKSGVVIGLGNEADLTPGRLTQAFAQGLVALGLELQELEQDRPQNLALPRIAAAVLIGSGEAGLDLGTCLTALLRGMVDAQRRLQSASAKPFEELQLFELYQDRAIQAWHAIRHIENLPQNRSYLRLDGHLIEEDGASRQTAKLRDANWWRPVQITEDKDKEHLTIVSAASGAQTIPFKVANNRQFVDRFVAHATGKSDRHVGELSPGRILFELLWPRELKEYSADDMPVRLQLSEDTADIPWELIDDRGRWMDRGLGSAQTAQEPPAVRFGVVRQLITSTARKRGTNPLARMQALIIGDPRSRYDESGFSPLPGAVAEAKAVANRLDSKGYNVTEVIDGYWEPEEIVNALFERPWSIVHIAAHGVVQHKFSEGGKKRTGVVLGRDWVLDSAIFEGLPYPPDLAFINCCHLGMIKDKQEKEGALQRERAGRPKLASNLGRHLLDMGCGAVIAAGWAVDDAAAKEFALTFYGEILDSGAGLGKASHKARQSAYSVSGNGANNTWGAYQVYGSPNWRLFDLDSTKTEEVPEFSCVAEFSMHIDTLIANAQVAVGRRTARLRRRADQLGEIARSHNWHKNAQILASMAQFHADLGDFSKSVALYEEAKKADKATLPVKAIEQLYNITIRKAARGGLDDITKRNDAVEKVSRAIKELDELTSVLGETTERYGLIASGHKRLAMLKSGRPRLDSLEKVEQSYKKSAELANDLGIAAQKYAGTNTLTIDVLKAMAQVHPVKTLEDIIDACEVKIRETPQRYDFWAWDGLIMADTCRMLAVSKLTKKPINPQDADKILDQYRNIWSSCGSDRRLASVIDQFDFMARILSDKAWKDRKICGPATDGLNSILEGLKQLGG